MFTAPTGKGRTSWKPPYALPNAGQVVEISANAESAVKPSTHTAGEWDEALFGTFGGGALVEDYSIGGAYVIAGTGGHATAPNLGAGIFDFADGLWKRLDNANGVANQNTDFTAAEIDTTFGEIIAASVAGIPAPAHVYAHAAQLRTSEGGGNKGSLLLVRGLSAAVDSTRSVPYSHSIDLETGLWTRKTTNAFINALASRVTIRDPVTGRYNMVHQLLHAGQAMNYVDRSDWTWKTDGFTNPGAIGNTYGAFLDEERRLLIACSDNENLYAFDADNISTLTTLTLSGSLTNVWEQSKFAYFPADGCFYRFLGQSTSATIEKLKPPSSSPLSNAWTASTVNLDTALQQLPAAYVSSGAQHYTRFFYVPSLGCLCWIPGGDEPVVLLKPPA